MCHCFAKYPPTRLDVKDLRIVDQRVRKLPGDCSLSRGRIPGAREQEKEKKEEKGVRALE